MTNAKEASKLIFSIMTDVYHGEMPSKVRRVWAHLDDELMALHKRRERDKLFSRSNTAEANFKLLSNELPHG